MQKLLYSVSIVLYLKGIRIHGFLNIPCVMSLQEEFLLKGNEIPCQIKT